MRRVVAGALALPALQALYSAVFGFLRVGISGEVHEILVTGPPWDTTACVRFTDRALGSDGAPVYENRTMILLKSRWGKVVSEEIFEDTERTAAFDRYLELNEPRVTPAALKSF